MKEKRLNYKLAKNIIKSYFEALSNKDKLSTEGFVEAFIIETDKEALLQHIIAMKNIFTKAEKELQEEIEEEKNEVHN